MFTDAEKAYLQGQRLARIATVSSGLQPDVAPVAFKFEEGRFYVGGFDLQRTRKYKNVLQNARLSLVVDDLVAVEPWTPRGIGIHGQADIVSSPEEGELIRITVDVKWSWGINQPAIKDGKDIIDKATRT